jgi:hypothetical protein
MPVTGSLFCFPLPSTWCKIVIVVEMARPDLWTAEPGIIDELIGDGRKLGFEATKRLIYDWVGLGLLDHPVRRTRGEGGSDKALWSWQQRNLFRLLASHRSQTKSVAQLAKFPIGLWLYFGESYVPTSQAARAMRTWAVREANPSMRASFVSARELVKLLDQPDSDPEARRHLVALIAESAHEGTFDRDELLQAVWAVFDSPDEGRVLGVAPLVISPEQFVDFLATRLAGVRVAQNVTEEQLVAVWRANQAARPGWERMRPDIEPRVTREVERPLFAAETNQQLFDNAPTTVLTLLGMFFGGQGGQNQA